LPRNRLTLSAVWQNPKLSSDKLEVSYRVSSNGSVTDVTRRLVDKLGGLNISRAGTKICFTTNGGAKLLHQTGPLQVGELSGAVAVAVAAM